MKILSVLASPAAGGAEMLVRNLSAEFTARGHSARIVFMSDAVQVGNPADFEQQFLAELDEAGVQHEVMPRECFRSIVKSTRAFRNEVNSYRPDIIHIHLARGLICRSLSRISVPTIYTHHNVTANFPSILFKLFDRKVDHFVAIGEACRHFLEKHIRSPITSIPNGVPASFSQSDSSRRMPHDPLILSVGNLTAKKDYGTLIEAARLAIPHFAAEGRAIRFAIAGEGAERAKLEAMIEAHGVSGNFELLGARSDVAALMQQATLLVNSSVHEGLPITLIEASMSGLPMVVTDVGGNAEVVADGSNGYVVPPERPDLISDRIISLLSDRNLYGAFSARACVVSEQFTISNCAESHLQLYRLALSRSAGC